MRAASRLGRFLTGTFLGLSLLFPTGSAQAQEPTTAHTSTMQTLTVTHPMGAGGWSYVRSYDYISNTDLMASEYQAGGTTEHPIMIRQYLTTDYAFENWGGAWIYDASAARWSGVMFFIQQPLPSLPTRPSTAPTNLQAALVDFDDAHLTWEDNAVGENGYAVYQRQSGSTTWNYLGTSPNNAVSATWGPFAPGTWEFLVRVVESGVETGESNVASLTVPASSPAPTNAVASLDPSGSVVLTWQDNCSFETGFSLLYRPAGATNWTQKDTTPADAQTFTFIGNPGPGNWEFLVRVMHGGTEVYESNIAPLTI